MRRMRHSIIGQAPDIGPEIVEQSPDADESIRFFPSGQVLVVALTALVFVADDTLPVPNILNGTSVRAGAPRRPAGVAR